jgi:hypothetical protein
MVPVTSVVVRRGQLWPRVPTSAPSSPGTLARDLPPLPGSAELDRIVSAIGEGVFQREQEGG